MKKIIGLLAVGLLSTPGISNAASISITGDVTAGTGVITFTDLTFDVVRPSDPIAFGLDGWATSVDGTQDFDFLTGEIAPGLERGPSDFSPGQGELNGYPAILDNSLTGTTGGFGADGFEIGTTFFYFSWVPNYFEGVTGLFPGDTLTIKSMSYVLPTIADWNPEVFGDFIGNARLYNAQGLAVSDNLAITAVPVPAAVWLFGSALAGLGWLRRRQAG